MNRLRGASTGALFNQLERLFGQGTSLGSSEGELLERFVNGHDEVAFEALVARHGPMVLGVCRQLLRDPNDVDDAFQATFLVLVRKAGKLHRRDLLGNWLYGVAFRVAARARVLSARRNSRVAAGHVTVESLSNVEYGKEGGLDQSILLEQGPGLHHEVSHLPEKYRVPIVLCYFEGLTHDEAASRLGWPLGTVKGRLARARDLLRRRLTRRGVTLSATAICSHLSGLEAKAAVPASLRMMTLKAAYALICEAGASLARSSAVSLPVSALVEGVLHTMIANQIKSIALTSFLVVGTVSTGVIVGATQLSGGSANAAKGTQVPASSANSVEVKSRGTGGQATSEVSPQLARQLSATHTSFGELLSTFREPEITDIDWLGRWSLITLEADKVLGSTDADRLAAFTAHRDRMKRLHDFTQKIPVSDMNKREKADHAQNILHQAEEWLENSRQGATPRKGIDMRSKMRRGMMAGGGRMGMMGSGGGASGTMAGMMKSAFEPAPSAGISPASQTNMKDAPKPGAPAVVSEPDGLAKKPGDNSTQELQKGVARTDGQNQAVAKTNGMGGGRGGMGGGLGGGMGGMGGGMAGMGGMGGRMGGMMGAMSQEDISRQLRWMNAATAAGIASRDVNPQTKAILKKLDESVSMSFAEDTALEDVLTYIKHATSTSNSAAIPIYVDPKGLKDADATLQSPIRLNLEGVPLKTTLRLMLKQIGLAYCVRDGVLIISSVQGINDELREAQREIDASDPNHVGGGGFGGEGVFQ